MYCKGTSKVITAADSRKGSKTRSERPYFRKAVSQCVYQISSLHYDFVMHSSMT